MKKFALVCTVLLFNGLFLVGQSIEVTPMAGYTFNGRYTGANGSVYTIADQWSFGATVGVQLYDDSYFLVSYRYSAPVVEEFTTALEVKGINLGIEQYQLGLSKEFGSPAFNPFANISVGASRYFERGGFDNQRWLFSGIVGGGIKHFLSKTIGVQLSGNLIIPMDLTGSSLLCDFGSRGSNNCPNGGASFIPFVHWEIMGGLVFKINTHKTTEKTTEP